MAQWLKTSKIHEIKQKQFQTYDLNKSWCEEGRPLSLVAQSDAMCAGCWQVSCEYEADVGKCVDQ